METGKVEYAPDYKSRSAADVAARIDQIITTDLKRQAEISRLERAVIDAAKAQRAAQLTMFALGTEEGCHQYEVAYGHFENTLTSLIEFEAKQK